MTDLRKLAKGKPCMVRFPGICNFNPETTVLAHVRMGGLSGMGIKAEDLFGSWACSACHDYVDGRTHIMTHDRDARRLALLEGVLRTQSELVRLGHLSEADVPVSLHNEREHT